MGFDGRNGMVTLPPKVLGVFFLFGTWPMGIDGLHVVEVRQRPGFCLIRDWNLPSKTCWSGDFLLQTTMLINFFEGGSIICGNGWALGIGKTETSCPQLSSNQRSWQESLQQIFNEIDDSNANQVGVMFHQ